MCEDERCDCHHRGDHHRKHHHHHGYGKYSAVAKKTGEQSLIPEILLEVAEIKEGDFFKIYIKKIEKHKKKH
jgi:hypothetical protein